MWYQGPYMLGAWKPLEGRTDSRTHAARRQYGMLGLAAFPPLEPQLRHQSCYLIIRSSILEYSIVSVAQTGTVTSCTTTILAK